MNRPGRAGKTPKTGLARVIFGEIWRYASGCMAMHTPKNSPVRFWRVSGEKTGFFMAEGVKTP